MRDVKSYSRGYKVERPPSVARITGAPAMTDVLDIAAIDTARRRVRLSRS
jgi:hypothetical protein